jgi:hypothetical protein
VSRGSHSGIFTLETSTTGEKPFSLTDKPLDELFPAQVRLHAALNGNEAGAAYLLGTENEDSPFLAKLCLNSDEHQGKLPVFSDHRVFVVLKKQSKLLRFFQDDLNHPKMYPEKKSQFYVIKSYKRSRKRLFNDFLIVNF